MYCHALSIGNMREEDVPLSNITVVDKLFKLWDVAVVLTVYLSEGCAC
jgi:hypothetical protein